jgi:hypothetical protein
LSQSLQDRFPYLYFDITEASALVTTEKTKILKNNPPSFAQIVDATLTQHGIQSAGLVGDLATAAEEYYAVPVAP